MTERQGGYFCTIDLKVEGRLLKLRVKKGDTFADLVNRLIELTPKNKFTRQQLAQRLRNQLKSLLTHSSSTPFHLRTALESLLGQEEKKQGVVVGEHATEEVSRSNQTPFRILQESLSNARQAGELKRQYKYLADDSYQVDRGLNAKYGSDEFTKVFEQCHIRQSPPKSVGKDRPTYRYMDMIDEAPKQQRHNYLNAGLKYPLSDYSSIEPSPRPFTRVSPSPQPVQSFHDYKFSKSKSSATLAGGARRPRNYLQEEQGGWEREAHLRMGGQRRKFDYLNDGAAHLAMRW